MIDSIVKLAAGIIGYLAAHAIDAFVGKWLAHFVIAWEEKASDKSKAAYAETMKTIKANMPAKAAAWESWRKRASQITS